LHEEPWDVDEQLGMEKCDMYLEDAKEDIKRGLHRVADQLEKQWRDSSALVRLLQNWDDLLQNRVALLQQTSEHAHPVMENLFLHNNHWKNKHMLIVWQCGMVMKGWQNLWAKG
jgi:hypothetical protein